MREFSNHAVLSMSDSTMAVSSKYTQDLSVQIVFFTFSCKWVLCFYFCAVIWSYIVDLFAALHELASASSRTLLKLASSVRALLKPYGDTLRWLTTVFPRLSSARYDSLPHVSLCHACKNDASNLKNYQNPLQHLKGVKSLWYM